MKRSFWPKRLVEWLGVIALLAILAAIFMPVYAYSGPGLSHYRVASDMANQYRLYHHWPKNEEEHALGRIPQGRSYSYRFERTLKGGALYRIVVDGKTELWKANEIDKPKRLAAE